MIETIKDRFRKLLSETHESDPYHQGVKDCLEILEEEVGGKILIGINPGTAPEKEVKELIGHLELLFSMLREPVDKVMRLPDVVGEEPQ